MAENSGRSDTEPAIEMDIAPAGGVAGNLEFMFDDHAAPSELTIFDPDTLDNGATEWITIDHEAAVQLDEIQ